MHLSFIRTLPSCLKAVSPSLSVSTNAFRSIPLSSTSVIRTHSFSTLSPSSCSRPLSSRHITTPTMAPSFKLYYSPTSCGAANYIVASLNGLSFDSEIADFRTKKTASGADFLAINPKGNVPAIVFSDGRPLLNENGATLTFLGDQNLDTGLTPAEGTPRRYEYLNALGFVNSELHPRVGGLFNPMLPEDVKDKMRGAAAASVKRFVDLVLDGKDFCLEGDKPTTVDIYAYIVLTWCPFVGVDLSDVPEAGKFSERVKAVPGVVEAHAEMDAAAKA